MEKDLKHSEQSSRPLTAQEAADYLGIPIGSLYVRVSKREIRALRLGRLLRFRREDLENLFKERE